MSELKDLFKDPPASYRPQPFWFLNRECSDEMLRLQIAEMADKGVGGVVLHCRHGLLIPHMGEKWMHAIETCIDALKENGMEAWLYDEDDWPSGTFGGKLTRPHPEYRMRYLRVQEMRVHGGATFQCSPEADDNTIICIHASKYDVLEDGVRPRGSIDDVTGAYKDGKFRWEAPPGEWLVVFFWECPVPERVTWDCGYYLDTMNPEAVGEFKRLAYDPYDRFSKDFGDTVKGMFTDEPGLMIHDGFFGTESFRHTVEDPTHKLPGHVIAWTRGFFERFRQFAGYDIRARLMALMYDIGPETHKIRQDYYRALSKWYVESYHAALSHWCDERGLDYIGHTLEEPLWNQVRTQGNQTMVLEQLHRPGLDYLGHGVGTRENPFRILSAKCAASVAHVQGKPRVMCEAFGGSGHGHTMADRLLDANFMACLGVNMMIPHAFYYSFQGFRKTDWPPTEFYHAPFWPWYKTFADYLGRLCLFGATGHHVSDCCVVPPIKTLYNEMFENGKSYRVVPAQNTFDRVSDLLLRLHHDYDYVDDTQLVNADPAGGTIGFPVSAEKYPLVILPGIEVMSLAAARMLAEFFRAGGKIIAIGAIPSEADQRGDDEPVRNLMREVFGEIGDADARNEHESGGVALYLASDAELEDWLRENVPALVEPDVVITTRAGQASEERVGQVKERVEQVKERVGQASRLPAADETPAPRGSEAEDIICCHRVEGDKHLYLLVNRTKTDQSCTFKPKGSGHLDEWLLESGDSVDLTGIRAEDGRLAVDLDFEPCEARLFVLDAACEPSALDPDPEPRVVGEIALDSRWRFEAQGGNVHILDQWDYTIRDLDAGNKVGVVVPGQVNSYTTTFEVAGRTGEMKLVFDDLEQTMPSHAGYLMGKRDLEIYLNGKQLPALEPSTWQDPYFLEVDITPHVQMGVNSLEILSISILYPFPHLTEPVYIVGDFSVAGGKLLSQPRTIEGPLSEAGYPHFAGIAAHTQTVDIPEEYLIGQRLMLDPGEVHDACRVVVNGVEVAVRLWPPYEVDITSAVKPGRNEIVVEVANSLGNLYGKETRTSGLTGEARIWVVE
jgi:hypothetical protein